MIAEKAADLIAGHGLPTAAATPCARSAVLTAQPRARLTDLADTQARAEPEGLDDLWEALASVCPEQILGTWRGIPLNTGHFAQRRLREMRWYGKKFTSPDDVQPLIYHARPVIDYSH